jgi:hypothetical protein
MKVLSLLIWFFASFAYAQELQRLDLTIKDSDLYDSQTGIYANPSKKGKEWRRPATLNNEAVEISIHGGASRERSPTKSFRVYKKDGVLVLRAGFNDTWTHSWPSQQKTAIYIKDQVARDVFTAMGFWNTPGSWVELYINNKFYSLVNIVERIERSGWEIIKEGDSPSLTPDNIDLKNFTDYIIINTWLQNYDWPQKNWYAFKNKNSKVWQFTLWDVEYSFGGGAFGYKYNHNTPNHALLVNSPISKLLKTLLRNPEYKTFFWNEMARLLTGYLNANYLGPVLDRHAHVISPALPKIISRWAQNHTINDYEVALNLAKEFTQMRTKYFIRYWRSYLGNPPANFPADLLVDTEPAFWDKLSPWKTHF